MYAPSMYDPVLLRTFLAVSHSLSFTQAAMTLGLGQPTVSQHVRRLETAVGRALFIRDTHSVRRTADGDAMREFALSILAAQDRAVSYFTGSGLSGRVRFGVTDDLALTSVPRILRDFGRLYPRIDLELTVAANDSLQRQLESGHLDIAFVKLAPDRTRGRLVRRDRLVWVGTPGVLTEGRPVPLIVDRAPSISRSFAVEAMDRAGIPYRVTTTARNVLGAVAACRAGLGLGIFLRSLIPAGLIEIPVGAGLPELGEIDLVLLASATESSASAEALTEAILGDGQPLGAEAVGAFATDI